MGHVLFRQMQLLLRRSYIIGIFTVLLKHLGQGVSGF